MTITTLHDLLYSELKDAYSAEQQIITAFPDMIAQAAHEELGDALEMHLEETRKQVSRLNTIAQKLSLKLEGHECKAMRGIIEEAKELLRTIEGDNTRDAAIISMAQRVEHYEMAVYGTAKAYADELSLTEVSDLLKETYDEEVGADKKLTGLATGGWFSTGVNQEAVE